MNGPDPFRKTITELYFDDMPLRKIGLHVGLTLWDIQRRVTAWQLPKRSLAPPKGRVPLNEAPRPADEPKALGPIGDFPPRGHCTFIAGHPGPDFQCCGHKGYPFCDYHHARCYIKKVAA